MKCYLVEINKIGTALNYPDINHKNYKNAGYNADKSRCIWVAKDDVDMQAEGVTEISKEESNDYLATWEEEKQSN